MTSVIQPLRIPAVSVDVALPWFTGQPYALYAHVRAITAKGPTGWSKSFAFNTRWPSVPKQLPSQPGLVRWTLVDGATGYQVWYPDVQKSFSTHTNVADLREFYTLKNLYGTVHWRVRAVRRVFGDIPNGLPAVSYGPWSQTYTTTNPAPTATSLSVRMALSDRISDGAKQAAHALMPGLVFNGDLALDNVAHSVNGYQLFRAYAATDRDCVNIVFRGSVVGSPAYAPRTTGPLALPNSAEEIQLAIASPGVLRDVDVPNEKQIAFEWTTDWRKMTAKSGPNELPLPAAASSGSATADPSSSDPASEQSSTIVGTRVDLPDIDFPTTRYYWTVVPVVWAVNPSDPTKKFGWLDVETPQDACAAGRVESFGKESAPVLAGKADGSPYVAGLKVDGRLLASAGRRPKVYSTPLVAWKPATAATAYEVQWSRTVYPWRAQGSKMTYSTSAVLDLAPGKWFYRIRGLNQTQLKKVAMSWSTKVPIIVAQPKFRLVSSK